MTVLIILTLTLLLLPLPALAQVSLLPPCVYGGNCGLCDIVDVIGRISEFLLYFLGVSIFGLFIVGVAWYLMWKRGNSESIQRGKDLMWNAVYGGIVVLAAWQLVNFVLFGLGTAGGSPSEVANANGQKVTFKIFCNPWDYVCEPPLGSTDPDLACFSRGVGTPCKLASGTNTLWGHCDENGTCFNEDACTFLANNDDYQDYFGNTGQRQGLDAYSCVQITDVKRKREEAAGPDPNNPKLEYDCLEDETLCREGQYCCGPAKLPKCPKPPCVPPATTK